MVSKDCSLIMNKSGRSMAAHTSQDEDNIHANLNYDHRQVEDDNCTLIEDETSSSGSSEEDDEHPEQNGLSESEDDTEQVAKAPMRAGAVMIEGNSLRARLQAFMPGLRDANAELLHRIENGEAVDQTDILDEDEDDDDDDGKEVNAEYVEMNLGLGVLSEQSSQAGEEIKLPKRGCSPDSDVEAENRSFAEILQPQISVIKKAKVVEEMQDK